MRPLEANAKDRLASIWASRSAGAGCISIATAPWSSFLFAPIFDTASAFACALKPLSITPDRFLGWHKRSRTCTTWRLIRTPPALRALMIALYVVMIDCCSGGVRSRRLTSSRSSCLK